MSFLDEAKRRLEAANKPGNQDVMEALLLGSIAHAVLHIAEQYPIRENADELKPCPFCRSHVLELLRDDLVDYFVNCKHCGANGPHERTGASARASWNKR
jgi:Lar family restriction alleviation protein